MKSSSSSTRVEDLQDSGLLAKVRSPQFRTWFLLIVVGLIVVWLSVEAFPLAWARLMQMVGAWSTLQAASGSAMFAPFAILLLQVLCFLAAWAILALVVVREVLAFKDTPGQVRSAPALSVANVPALAPMPAPSREQDVADASSPPDTANADEDEQNPFDMSAAIFDLPSDPDETEQEEKLTPAIVEEETVFVYGDPLADNLPEIFSYDIDLMRDVQEMQNARAQAQANQVDNSNLKEEMDSSSNRDKKEQNDDETAKKAGSAPQSNTKKEQDDSAHTKKANSDDGGSGTKEQEDKDQVEKASRDDSRPDQAVKVKRSRKKSSTGTIAQEKKP
ncbi:hypothetical protein [Dictyobacter aurantiacus]|nr:hypothetical protein [Dictyobacter aurantiacus]